MAQSSKLTPDLLYQRLLKFAQGCQRLVGKLPKTVYNLEYGSQLIRSSASPGANYIEAVEASSRREFIYKLKICRRETKESLYWVTLIQGANRQVIEIRNEAEDLIKESRELIRIFTSSILTSERNKAISK